MGIGNLVSSKRIDFFIVGAQKSSTTFLHHALAQHPDIYMPAVEISLFQPRHFSEKNLETLLNTFPPDRRWGIKRPNYLYSHETARLLFKHNPKAKIFIVLRNPIERAVSAYFHLLVNAQIPALDIESGMRKILDGTHSFDWPMAYTILSYGKYSIHLETYTNLFSEDQIYIFEQKAIKQNPQTHIDLACAALGLDSVSVAQLSRQPLQSVVYEMGSAKLLNRAAQIESLCNRDGVALQRRRHLSFWRRSIAKMLRRKAYSGNDRWKKPVLSEDLRQRLEEYYREDMPYLEPSALTEVSVSENA
jgi:hypothetical protein